MADTSVKLSGTYDSIEAYNIMVEMQNMSADYEEIRTEAAAAASAATAASTAATNAVNTANTAVANAQTYAGNANTSAGEAAGYASDASTSATNAASSETNASNSATAAAASAANAASSEAVVAGALPLTGGTMTGPIKGNNLTLTAENGGNSSSLILGATGTATWNGNNIDAVVLKEGTSDTGGYCVRYANGIQICWGGEAASTSGKQVNFLYPFVAVPRIISGTAGSSTHAWVSNDSATGFKAVSASATPWLNWFAIGFWK